MQKKHQLTRFVFYLQAQTTRLKDMFKQRKEKAIKAFQKDLELLEDPENHNKNWGNGLAENIRVYIGKDSPLYELALKFDFYGYMAIKKGDPKVKTEAQQLVNQAIAKVELNGTTGVHGIYERISNMDQLKVASMIGGAVVIIFTSGGFFGKYTATSSQNKEVLDAINHATTAIKAIQLNLAIADSNNTRVFTGLTSVVDSTFNIISNINHNGLNTSTKTTLDSLMSTPVTDRDSN